MREAATFRSRRPLSSDQIQRQPEALGLAPVLQNTLATMLVHERKKVGIDTTAGHEMLAVLLECASTGAAADHPARACLPPVAGVDFFWLRDACAEV